MTIHSGRSLAFICQKAWERFMGSESLFKEVLELIRQKTKGEKKETTMKKLINSSFPLWCCFSHGLTIPIIFSLLPSLLSSPQMSLAKERKDQKVKEERAILLRCSTFCEEAIFAHKWLPFWLFLLWRSSSFQVMLWGQMKRQWERD